jgi:DNA-binding FadR family transcriptional regulator
MVRQKELHAPAGRRKLSQHATVARGIGLAIVSGEIAVGSILPAKEVLMARFGVSNTSLREALQTLTAKGLLEARTRIGTWVLDTSRWNMFDADILSWQLEAGVDTAFLARLFEMRQTLEPMAAAAAALRRSDAQAEELVALATRMKEDGHDKDAFTELDVAFHLSLLDASQNPFMRSIGAAIATALAASFLRSGPTDDPTLVSLAHRQHAAIAEAVMRRDPQAAADAMMAVIRQGWSFAGDPARRIARIEVKDYLAAALAQPRSEK